MGGLVWSSCCGGGGHAGRGGPSQGSQARTSAATLRWSEAQDKLEPRGGVRQPSLAFPSPAAPEVVKLLIDKGRRPDTASRRRL